MRRSNGFAAEHATRPVPPCLLDEVQHLGVLRLGRDRPDLRRGIERVADADVAHRGDQPLDEAIMDPILQQESRARDAGLTQRQENTRNDAVDRVVQPRIVEDDLR